jgi:hypothetical protein
MSEKILNQNSVAVWPILLEKALVKSVGGYQKLLNSNTSVSEFLRDFTGAPSKSVDVLDDLFTK